MVTKGVQTSVRLDHERLQPLTECRDAVLQALSCEMFTHPDKGVLFQKPGMGRMEAVQRTTRAYLHWDRPSRSVRVFGRPADRQVAMAALSSLVLELKQLQREQFLLSAQGAKQVWASGALAALQRVHGIVELDLHGSLLEAWAPDAGAAAAVRGELQRRGWLKEPRRRDGDQELCALCTCGFDDEVWQLQACGHRFCTACLRNALADPDGAHFPVQCPQPLPAGMCRQALLWRDLTGLYEGEVLNRIKHLGVDAFLRERPAEGMYCPKEGCNHILRPPGALCSLDEARQRWGVTVFCEACSVEYCLQCSEAARKACSAHPGRSCGAARMPPEVQEHRHHIIDQFLTLRCPRCKRAFLDYSGCAAVTCHACNCGFCAKCFKDCGRDAHEHARECRGPFPGVAAVSSSLFLATEEFNRLNLQVAQHRVWDYLSALNPGMRKDVVEACHNDFKGFPAGDLVIPASLVT